jgi:urease accessory protein
MTVPLYLDPTLPGMAFVYIQNPTGGLFGGDRLTIRVVAEAGSEVHLTTPAATKVCRTESNGALETVELRLGKGVYLEYLPEPVIPYAGSRYRQDLVVDLEDQAIFVMAETITPGRTARGELFAYTLLERRATARRGRAELFADAIRLEPGRWLPSRFGVLGSFTYFSSFLVIAPSIEPSALADGLEATLPRSDDSLAAAGVLPGESGAVVRILARSLPSASAVIDMCWATTRRLLSRGSPPRRRK